MRSLKQIIGLISLVVGLMPTTVCADHDTDWDDWYAGEVETRVKIKHGEGSIFAPGESIRIEFKTDEDAYHLVFAIDTEGYVRLLFPRYWEDDGWVPRGKRIKLRGNELAWPADRWGDDGIVYLEVVASPEPFDWQKVGVHRRRNQAVWLRGDRPWRIHGDPFLAFNDIHEQLFSDWESAVFAVDYTYFYVGSRTDAPNYLDYPYQRVYVAPPQPRWYVNVRFGWRWHFGARYSRPVYRSYYHRGRHIVHHHQHHVDYPASKRYVPYVARDGRRYKHREYRRGRHRVTKYRLSDKREVRTRHKTRLRRKEARREIRRREKGKEVRRHERRPEVRRKEARKEKRKELRKKKSRRSRGDHDDRSKRSKSSKKKSGRERKPFGRQ